MLRGESLQINNGDNCVAKPGENFINQQGMKAGTRAGWKMLKYRGLHDRIVNLTNIYATFIYIRGVSISKCGGRGVA